MKLNVVSSGSKGNCYILFDGTHALILDCGSAIPWREIVKASGYRTSAIDAALVTHRHRDHLGHIRDLHMSGIEIYSNEGTRDFAKESSGEEIKILPEKKKSVLKGGWQVIPWYVPHEYVPNYAYFIIAPSGEKFAYLTDFEYSPATLKTFGVNHFLIAISRSESVPEDAEAREHRIRGHSSLDVVQSFLDASVTESTRTIIACHLSDVYASAGKVEQVLSGLFPSINVYIARKGMSIDLEKGTKNE